MRALFAAVSLAFVAGCSDRIAPIVTYGGRAPSLDVSGSPSGKPATGPRAYIDTTPLDTMPVLARIGAMMTASLVQIPIPADSYSNRSDAVHPDVACTPAAWNNARCWVTYTPYLGSDPTWENPSFLIMTSDTTWRLPAGVANPIVPWPGVGAYNSDPDQAFDPGTGRLITFYREVSGGYNNIKLISTGNGRTWSEPTLAFRETNHDAVSPAVVIGADRTARMWYVKSGSGCTAGSTSVRLRTAQPTAGRGFEDATWSASQPVQMTQPGFAIWHMDVIDLPGGQGYVAVMADHAANTDCASDDIWLAISRDGLSWHTFAVPILWRGMTAAKRLGVQSWYRAAMRYDAAQDSLHIWPSALMSDNTWVIYHTSVKFTDLVRALLAATLADQPTAQLHIASKVPDAIRKHMP